MKYLNSLTRHKKVKNSFLLIFFGFLLLSCGGGGGGVSSPSSDLEPNPNSENPLPLNDNDIGSVFVEFNFRRALSNNFQDIDRISVEYTTSNNGNYEFNFDTDNNDFTKNTPYFLENLVSNTTYYYRIKSYVNGEPEERIGNFKTNLIDNDKNGLIEIGTLRQLYNMRYNLKGTSYKTDNSNATGSTSGCPDEVCRGYELTRNLDFDKNRNGSTWSTSTSNGTINLEQGDNAEPYFVVDSLGSGGWEPIGEAQQTGFDSTCDNNDNNTCFDTIFDGKGYNIKNLAIRRNLDYLGMFGAIGASADIRNLGLVTNLADYTGDSTLSIDFMSGLIVESYSYIGGLVGWQSGGSITASYATGNVVAEKILVGGYVGGLVGEQSGGSITASYATGKVNGGAGGAVYVGGLVGEQDGGSITASYATGKVAGGTGGPTDYVGGLVGFQIGGSSITASYATGKVDGGGIGTGTIRIIANSFNLVDYVGGLVGLQGGSIIDSYGFGTPSRGKTNNISKPSGVSDPNDLTLSNAGGSWNSTTNDTSSAWDFGTTNQSPALKYADYDGTTAGKKFACEGAGNTITDANTIYLPYCGTFLPGQGRSPVGGASTTGASIALGNFALVDNDFDGYIEISNLVALGNIIYNPQGTSYKTSTASKGITSGCPRGVCRGYELTRSFSTTELESGGVDHYLINILTQDAVIKSNGYIIANIYFQE